MFQYLSTESVDKGVDEIPSNLLFHVDI